MENEWTGEVEEPDKVIEIGQKLLDLTDHLVERRDAVGLDLLDSVMCGLMASGVWVSDYDLLVLGEYAEFASQDLKAGKTVKQIKDGDVRKRAAATNST